MSDDWSTQTVAIGMRDIIAAIAENRINALRPESSYAVVQSINREQRSATVLYMGEATAVTVAMGSIEPESVGQTVRLGGTIGHRYIEDVLGNAIISGSDDRYAQTGHVHAGGSAVELDLNDLADVDTATNPPADGSVLGWNSVGEFWQPIAVSLGGSYLPLTGGTVTGSVNFDASVIMDSSLSVLGAVSGGSFAGIGTGLTNLNATQLTTGVIPVGRFPVTIGSNTTGTSAAWTTGRLLALTGDVFGTATIKGDADITMSVNLNVGAINLGSDTTGDYVATITGTANQIISNTPVPGEGTQHILSLPQNIHVGATPAFSRLSLTVGTGTAPLTITSQTMVSNLNTQLLGGFDSAYYLNAGNMNAGVLPSARLSGAYTTITGLGTLTTLAVAGVATFGGTPTVAGNFVWHAGNDGAGSGLDAGLLGGVLPAGYASKEIVEALMGDLMMVGAYDAENYDGEIYSLIFDRSLQSQLTGFSTSGTPDQEMDLRFDIELPVITQADVDAGANRARLIRNGLAIDIARTGSDDYLNRTAGNATTPNTADLASPSVFTLRARVRKTDLDNVATKVIARHGSTPGDERWTFQMTGGALELKLSNNGSATPGAFTPVLQVLTFAELDAIAGTADNTDFYMGASVRITGTTIEYRGWGSVNGINWTPASVLKTTPFPYSTLYPTGSGLFIGGGAGAGSGTDWDGRVYWVDMIPDSDPNGTSNPVFRFDSRDHLYQGPTTYPDPYNRTWTVSTTTTMIHATYSVVGAFTTNVASRTVTSPLFSYWQNVGKRWQVRTQWNPALDTMYAAWRDGAGGLALDAATPTWNEISAVYATETFAGTGAHVIGQHTSAGQNWSYGGHMYRAWIRKNAVTVLDLRNTNITVHGQMSITPSVGPVLTASVNTIAVTTMPKPVWAEGPTVYHHNIYWIVASPGEVDFIDSDFSGRYEIDADDAVTVANGDWLIAIDPLFGSPGHEEGDSLTLRDVVFQYVPFSTETYIKAKIQEHGNDPEDPHSAAGYLKLAISNALYSPLVHTHAAEISGYINLHEQKSDPHPQYMTQIESDGRYVKPGDLQPYEPLGTVLAHEQKADPHPQYVSHAEGNQSFSPTDHLHLEYSFSGHTHPTDDEVVPTDGAQSSRIFVGAVTPINAIVGDLWIETFDISMQPPAAPANLTLQPGPDNMALTWAPWGAPVAQTALHIDRSPDGNTWTNILTDVLPPFPSTYTDTGRAELTSYWYRVRAVNGIGIGAYGLIQGITTNAPPAVPTGLNATSVTPLSARLNWLAVTGTVNDPMHATQRYEVFKNGVSQGNTMSLFWDFTGLVERTAYNLAVRSRDASELTSNIATLSVTSANAAPPAPTGLGFPSWSHNNVVMWWNAVGGISDFSRYQMFLNGNYVAETTATSYNFTGLAPSTSYSFGVRSVDTLDAVSAIVAINGTTSVNPDTTPPAAVTFHSWRPRNNYGEMYFEFTAPGDIAYGECYYNINGAGWVVTYQGGLGGYHMHYNGTHAAGNTIYAAVNYRDAAGNWYYSPHYAYTLVSSPTFFAAHSSNSWRNTNGGEWNAPGGYRPVQGYYNNAALISTGFWFYGTDFQNWYQNGRQLTRAQIYMYREGCGFNADDMMGIYVHDMTASPGTTSFWGQPGWYGGVNGLTLRYGEAKWMDFPVQWAYELCAGQRRGLAIYAGGGKPYVCLHPAGTGSCGLVAFDHLG